ncbi:MAG: S8 family serine peptidase [Alphaproteobacteria bacterium]
MTSTLNRIASTIAVSGFLVTSFVVMFDPATAGEIRTALPSVKRLESADQYEELRRLYYERKVERLKRIHDLRNIEKAKAISTNTVSDQEEAYSTVKVRFYGQAVDLQLGQLLAFLAERYPISLQPVAIDRDFVLHRCVNNFILPPIVPKVIDSVDADELLRDMLRQSEKFVSEQFGGPLKFTVTDKMLREYRRLQRGDRPVDADAVRDLTLEEAFNVIDLIMRERLRLLHLDHERLGPFLRNVLVVAPDEVNLVTMLQRATRITDDGIPGPATRRALDHTDVDELWPRLLRQLAAVMHCDDADKVFKAYGLAYRKADYPSADQTIRHLSKHAKEASVPLLALREVRAVRVERIRQNCALFAPIGYPRSCTVDTIEVAGTPRFITIAGGVEVEFVVPTKIADAITEEMRKVVGERSIERRRASVLLEAPTRPQALVLEDIALPKNMLPCVENYSRFESANGNAIASHVSLYKKKFYPRDTDKDRSYPSILLLDYFPTVNEIQAAAEVLSARLQASDSFLTTAGVSPQVGLGSQDIVRIHIEKVCDENDKQIQALRKLSHGLFLKQLLLGGVMPIGEIGHIGILRFNGAVDAQQFGSDGKDLLDTINARGHHQLADSIANAVTAIQRIRDDPSFNSNENFVINISLSEIAYKLSERLELRDHVLGLHQSGLVIAAAGNRVDLEKAGFDATRLDLKSDLTDRADECHVYPACLSYLRNVLTVGAVDISSKADNTTPQLSKEVFSGSAVTVAAPGYGILSNDVHYLMSQNDVDERWAFAFRDGSSVAALFVSALAAEMLARFPELDAWEARERIISTTAPYRNGENKTEFLVGRKGHVLSGVIDVKAALRDPKAYQVSYRQGDVQEFMQLGFKNQTQKRLSLYPNTGENSDPEFSCKWSDLLRLHIFGAEARDGRNREILRAGVVCRFPGDRTRLVIGNGFLGTTNNKEDPCVPEMSCFEVRNPSTGLMETVDLNKVRDIYFAVDG